MIPTSYPELHTCPDTIFLFKNEQEGNTVYFWMRKSFYEGGKSIRLVAVEMEKQNKTMDGPEMF